MAANGAAATQEVYECVNVKGWEASAKCFEVNLPRTIYLENNQK